MVSPLQVTDVALSYYGGLIWLFWAPYFPAHGRDTLPPHALVHQGRYESTFDRLQRSKVGAWKEWLHSIMGRDLAVIARIAKAQMTATAEPGGGVEVAATKPAGRPGRWLLEAVAQARAASRRGEEEEEEEDMDGGGPGG